MVWSISQEMHMKSKKQQQNKTKQKQKHKNNWTLLVHRDTNTKDSNSTKTQCPHIVNITQCHNDHKHFEK
jgi:UDP-N-acetylglucosamine 2-epimerase